MSEPAKTIAVSFVDGTEVKFSVTDAQAMTVLERMREVFGWTGCVMSRADVEKSLKRRLTEAEWEQVQKDYNWESVIPEETEDSANWVLDNLIKDLHLSEVPEGGDA